VDCGKQKAEELCLVQDSHKGTGSEWVTEFQLGSFVGLIRRGESWESDNGATDTTEGSVTWNSESK
jgi:hypothetical protein